ncbi:50S ribosomal protein L9 [Patescibacteria group bacterium]|nr:50S ribosomal protein L9 [Patescibacteria group bacterium]
MKVILLNNVPNVGKKHDIKNVSDGYARNFLFPRKLAQEANTQNIQLAEKQKKQAEELKETQKTILEKNLEALNGIEIFLKEKTNEKGHLFKGITKKRISEILKKEKNIEIPEEIIELDKSIKEIGEHKIKIKEKEFVLKIS